MHTRVKVIAVCAIIAGAALVPILQAEPAAAHCHPRCEVDAQPDGLLGQVRDDVNTLNQYEGESNRVDCEGTVNGRPLEDGRLRWRLTAVDQEDWQDWGSLEEGQVMYRLECWSPEAGEFGELREVQEFDVNPRRLAELAMDEFFLGLPAPVPSFNPASPTMVNFETWMWVENIPEGQVASEPISVPGITVQAYATASGVTWEMGDGRTVECSDAGTPYNGQAGTASDCTHNYERSSAGQDGDAYHGSASVMWTGTYSVNGTPTGTEFPIPRETPFTLAVEEAQALNTEGE